MTEEPDGRVLKMIRHAAAAGGLRLGARRWPEAQRGLCKAARLHSARATALADELCGRRAAPTVESAALPVTADTGWRATRR